MHTHTRPRPTHRPRPARPAPISLGRITALLALSVLALLVAASPAAASLGVIGSPFGSGNSGIAVDPINGDVYQAESASNRVSKYDESGNFILTFGKEVNKTAVEESRASEEDVCPAPGHPADVCQAGAAGTAPGQLDGAHGVAVDPVTEDVYVAAGNGTYQDTRIERFSSAGHYLSQIVSEQSGAPGFGIYSGVSGIATDTEGNLYIVGGFVGGSPELVLKFNPAGEYTGQSFVVHGPRENVAVDANGFVYVSGAHPEGSQPSGVVKFAPNGVEAAYLTCRQTLGGLAVNLFNNEVFIAGSVPFNSYGEVEPYVCVFDSSGNKLEEFKAPQTGQLLQEMAYGAGAGRLYEAFSSGIWTYGTFPTPPQGAPTISREDWSEPGLHTITLSGYVTPNSLPTTYEFEYSTDPNLAGAEVAPASPGDAGSSFLPVKQSVAVSGLQQSTTYYYRLVAHNSFGGGAGSTTDGPIQTFTTLAPLPTATTGAASEISGNSALVSGEVIPGSNGAASDTKFCFEYGSTDEAGYDLGYTPGTPAGDAGQGTSPVAVSAHLSRLWPETTYRYRLLAVNSLGSRLSSRACGTEGGQQATGAEGTFTTGPAPEQPPPPKCPNEQFRSGPSAYLPDCRAYEQVSPASKNGSSLVPGELGLGPGEAPNPISEASVALPGAGAGKIFGGFYSSARSEAGWLTSPLDPPASGYELAPVPGGISYWQNVANSEGRAGLWLGRPLGAPEDSADVLLARLPGPQVEAVGPLAPPGTPPSSEVNAITNLGGLRSNIRGASADLSHVIFQLRPETHAGYHFWSFDPTTPPSSGQPTDVYEYIGTGNTQPLLVGVSGGYENGENHNLISTCGTSLGESFGFPEETHNAISRDGKTVYFTAKACGSNPGTSPPVNELFTRIENGEAGAHTVAISEPTSADCSACNTAAGVLQPASFTDASADGSKAFFTTTQPLLGADSSQNIYEYDFKAPAGERIVRVSAPEAGLPASTAAEVKGIVRASEDGSHLYFVASGALTAHPNSQGQRARAGANNLYAFARDAAHPQGRLAFIAALAPADYLRWGRPGISKTGAETTPDGRFLVFLSQTPRLTADDTSAGLQAFEYDAEKETLTRVSIGEDGYNHNGNSQLAEPGTNMPFRSLQNGQQNPAAATSKLAVSADGSYVFFTSYLGLTPRAPDHKQVGEFNGYPQYATNVYEYHDGNVHLLSSPEDSAEPRLIYLEGTDPSGADVFFTSTVPLAPSDTDSGSDLYDARINGGFPASVKPTECEIAEESCRGQRGTEEALHPNPLTEGNRHEPEPVPKPCRRGYVRKHGHCVKVRKHHRKRHHRHHRRANRRTAK